PLDRRVPVRAGRPDLRRHERDPAQHHRRARPGAPAMRFSFTSDQLALRDAFRELLERECTPEVVREPHNTELWKRVGEMGVLGLRRELDEIDLVLLLEEAGRALLPGPFLATAAVGVPALAEAGETEWLERVS